MLRCFTMAQRRLAVLSRHLEGHPKLHLTSYTSNQSHPHENEKFFYTLDNPILSRDNRIFYEQNGYIIIPDLIEEEILDACCERFAEICEEKVPKGSMTLMRDISLMKKGAKGLYLYNKVQDILYDEVFEKYFFHKKLLDVVECFTGPNIMGMHSMLINKPPDSGEKTSRHPLHQDLFYFPFRPAERIVASWTALEDVTTDNGCLVVIPGTHKGALLPHSYPDWKGGVNKMYHGVKDYNLSELIPVPMQKGATIFFHPLLLHGSGTNITKGFRRSISCHYAASECYYIDVEGTLQDSIAKEILEVAKKRGFEDTSFQSIWELRSRLIRGLKASL